MRRAQLILTSLLLLLAVPVAAAADRPQKAENASTAGPGSVEPARAAGVTDRHVTLTAMVVPGDAGSTATFQYGPTADYGFTAAATPALLPRLGATASASIDGLTPATTYHFRVVLGTGDKALAGADATFTTAAATATGGERDDAHDGATDDRRSDDDNGGGHRAEPIAPVQAHDAPVLGESLAVGTRSGTVHVRSPTGQTFTLTAGANVPAGSLIDATHGTVAMTSALDKGGNVQTAEFSGGRFVARQSAKDDGMVDIYLKGGIGRCRAAAASPAPPPRQKSARR